MLTAIDVAQPSLLILTDNHYPGWQADIDGNSTPIFTANLTQRAVFVPMGTHTITFRYQPKYVYYGLVISSVIFVLTVFLGVVRLDALWPRTRKKEAPRWWHRVDNHDM